MSLQFIIITGLLLFSMSSSLKEESYLDHQKKESDLDRSNLRGNVKSVRRISYNTLIKSGEIVKGNISRNRGIHNYVIFNKRGNRIEGNNYNPDGSLQSKHTSKYEYDPKGNWIRKIEFKDNSPKSIIEREIEYYE